MCAGGTLSPRPGVVLEGGAQPHNKCCSRRALSDQAHRGTAVKCARLVLAVAWRRMQRDQSAPVACLFGDRVALAAQQGVVLHTPQVNLL